MHHILLAAVVALATSESPEAAKVAAWVKAVPAPAPDASWFGALGATSVSLIGGGSDTIRSVGPRAFYNNAALLSQAVGAVQSRSTSYVPLMVADGVPWFRDVQNAPWGMIEVASGEFRWELLDAVVTGSQNAGGRYVGTVMPYAGWELTAGGVAPSTDEQCLRLFTEDFFYLAFDRRMDRYKNLTAWQNYLTRVVERYDGDGVDDMPGLTTPIRYWQVHNEPEGDHCGLFRNDVAGFVDLMRVSSAAIHAACPSCQVLNGGAGIPLFKENNIPVLGGTMFWRDYAALGGAPYIDVIAVHYNQGKDPDHGKIEDFEYQIRRARELLGNTKPVWVTEFGTLVGNPGGGNLIGLPEAEAGAWFVRFYAAGLAAGANRFFPDAQAFASAPANVIQLPYYVNKLLTARLGGFTFAEKLAAGQYRFVTPTGEVWVLWSGVPSSLAGTVIATDLYGNETMLNASALAPTATAPVLVRKPASRRRVVTR
jgi:hypothetical protein